MPDWMEIKGVSLPSALAARTKPLWHAYRKLRLRAFGTTKLGPQAARVSRNIGFLG
jgi:hypothetical protein